MFSKELLILQKEINNLLNSKSLVVISIDGKSASGKSTLAEALNEIYDCNIFKMDDFFLTPALRTEERLKEVGGNVDYLRFNKEIIQGILSQKNFNYNKYNCMNNSFNKSEEIRTKELNIIEGCYSMHPTLINYYDFKIFLDISYEDQIKRILKRNGKEKLQRFVDEWIPKENKYFNEMKIKDKADLIISV